jgi:1-acyl-sn-glycerol-3-phosphate acyltransferase
VSRRVDYVWRLVFTGMAFAALGLGGAAMAVTLFPAVALTTRDPVLRQRRVQRCVQLSFRLYIFLLRGLGVLSLELHDAEKKLAPIKGTLIVANHPTLLDVVLLMAVVPRAQCVVKHQLWRNPLLRPVVQGAGYISNSLAPEDLLAACTATLKAGNNLIIFPEGTRTRPGEKLQLRRGFANIATSAEADLALVTITCAPSTLTKGASWYDIPPTKPRFAVAVGEVLDIQSFLKSDARPLAARRLVTFLETYYTERLADGRSGTGDKEAPGGCLEARGFVA